MPPNLNLAESLKSSLLNNALSTELCLSGFLCENAVMFCPLVVKNRLYKDPEQCLSFHNLPFRNIVGKKSGWASFVRMRIL